MPRVSLTDSKVEKTPAPQSGKTELWDAQTPSLGLQINPSGRRSWTFLYRYGGQKKRIGLGRYPGVDLAEARRKARDYLSTLEAGHDPKTASQRALTFREAATEWMDKEAKYRQDASDRRRFLAHDALPVLENRPIAEVTRAEVAQVIDRLTNRGALVQANRATAYIKRLFQWALERGHVEVNPVAPLKAPTKETPRERTLDYWEIRLVWKAADRVSYPYGALIKLLILSGQRRGEMAGLTWDNVNLNTGEITFPATKNGSSHSTTLPALGMEILRGCPDRGSLVFATQSGGPLTNWSRYFRQLQRQIRKVAEEWNWSEPESFTVHDLRRSFASGAASLGIPPHHVEATLNHRSGTFAGITSVYQKYQYKAEIQATLQTWAEHLQEIGCRA